MTANFKDGRPTDHRITEEMFIKTRNKYTHTHTVGRTNSRHFEKDNYFIGGLCGEEKRENIPFNRPELCSVSSVHN